MDETKANKPTQGSERFEVNILFGELSLLSAGQSGI